MLNLNGKQYESEIFSIKRKHQFAIKRLMTEHNSALEALQSDHAVEVAHLKDSVERSKLAKEEERAAARAAEERANRALERQRAANEAALRRLKEEHAWALARRDEEARAAARRAEEGWERKVRELEAAGRAEKDGMKRRVEVALEKIQRKWQRAERRLEQATKKEATHEGHIKGILDEKQKELSKLTEELRIKNEALKKLKDETQQEVFRLNEEIRSKNEALVNMKDASAAEKKKLVQSITNDLESSSMHERSRVEAYYRQKIKELAAKWNAEKEAMMKECEHILAQTLELRSRMLQQQKVIEQQQQQASPHSINKRPLHFDHILGANLDESEIKSERKGSSNSVEVCSNGVLSNHSSLDGQIYSSRAEHNKGRIKKRNSDAHKVEVDSHTSLDSPELELSASLEAYRTHLRSRKPHFGAKTRV